VFYWWTSRPGKKEFVLKNTIWISICERILELWNFSSKFNVTSKLHHTEPQLKINMLGWKILIWRYCVLFACCFLLFSNAVQFHRISSRCMKLNEISAHVSLGLAHNFPQYYWAFFCNVPCCLSPLYTWVSWRW